MEEMRMRRGGRSESDDMYTRLDGTTLRPLFPFRFVSFCFSFVPVSVDFPPPPPPLSCQCLNTSNRYAHGKPQAASCYANGEVEVDGLSRRGGRAHVQLLAWMKMLVESKLPMIRVENGII